jgi:hypothetical protein
VSWIMVVPDDLRAGSGKIVGSNQKCRHNPIG